MTYSSQPIPNWNAQPKSEKEIPSLSELWAKKYIKTLNQHDQTLSQLGAARPRALVAQDLMEQLRSVSAQAWNKTESLLAHEMRRHQIHAELVDPWEISKEAHLIYDKALSAYAQQIPPQRLSILISADLGAIRKKHTSLDPRVIGFVSMQFHYCSQLLLNQLPTAERAALEDYFKVIDDYLYMPLQRAYDAAANYDYDDPRLKAVQALLPLSSAIARAVVNQVHQRNPHYLCYSGPLNSATVRASSLRDVEMFQVYLWTCVLEKNISVITQELFPLCVMLYPTLNVSWELVRQMITLLGKEFAACAEPPYVEYYLPYYQAIWKMFSPDVFATKG